MLKKIGQIVFFILFISIIALVQFSGIYALPSFFRDFNLILIALLFVLFFYDFNSALGVVIIGGFWFDILSFNFFGFYLISLFLTLIFTEWVLKTWLTNRSLYSFLLLILLATLVNNIFVGVFTYFSINSHGLFFVNYTKFGSILINQIILGELWALLLFSIASKATRQFQPFFLDKK